MKIHSTKTKCYQHSPYGRTCTDNDDEVTCMKCLHVLGRDKKVRDGLALHGKPIREKYCVRVVRGGKIEEYERQERIRKEEQEMLKCDDLAKMVASWRA